MVITPRNPYLLASGRSDEERQRAGEGVQRGLTNLAHLDKKGIQSRWKPNPVHVRMLSDGPTVLDVWMRQATAVGLPKACDGL
jgi:hypothetical protein